MNPSRSGNLRTVAVDLKEWNPIFFTLSKLELGVRSYFWTHDIFFVKCDHNVEFCGFLSVLRSFWLIFSLKHPFKIFFKHHRLPIVVVKFFHEFLFWIKQCIKKNGKSLYGKFISHLWFSSTFQIFRKKSILQEWPPSNSMHVSIMLPNRHRGKTICIFFLLLKLLISSEG